VSLSPHKGERGKFQRPDATLDLPVYLDDDLRSLLQRRARNRGVEVNELVNELLKRELRPGR